MTKILSMEHLKKLVHENANDVFFIHSGDIVWAIDIDDGKYFVSASESPNAGGAGIVIDSLDDIVNIVRLDDSYFTTSA